MKFSSRTYTIIQRMCKRYGADSQIDVCIEEMSELTKALIKSRRSKLYTRESEYDGVQEIKEEIADVYLMLEYIKHIFNLSEYDINILVTQKAERTMRRYLNETNTDSK